MSVQRRQRRAADGRTYSMWRVRWYDVAGVQRSRTFARAVDARAFDAQVRTLKRSDGLAELDAGKETIAEFVEEWWRLYAVPNLERSTLKVYASLWNSHGLGRLGHLRLRDLDPQGVMKFRSELERAGVGPEATRKTLALVQGVFQRAVEWGRVRSNPVRLARKPRSGRKRAIHPLSPANIEELRAALLVEGRPRDAVLVSALAYAGLRPQEALALTWRSVRDRTLLVESALADGVVKGQKTGAPPRAVDLLGPLKEDLLHWRLQSGQPEDGSLVFPNSGGQPWREYDWRNWRRRVYVPAVTSCGFPGRRPYDLRHSFASLLIHEGRLSIVEIAHQLGHSPTTCLSTYAHVMAELRDAEKEPAADQIWAARRSQKGSRHATRYGPKVAHAPQRGLA